MKIFIPVTDDMLERDPDLWERLVPFHVDRPCHHLAAEPLHSTPADLQQDIAASDNGRNRGLTS